MLNLLASSLLNRLTFKSICVEFHDFVVTFFHSSFTDKKCLCLLGLQMQPPEVFCKKAVLKTFVIFTGKHFCWGLFLIKLQAFRPATLLKRNFNTGVFPWTLLNFHKHLLCRKSANGCFWNYKMNIITDIFLTSSGSGSGWKW